MNSVQETIFHHFEGSRHRPGKISLNSTLKDLEIQSLDAVQIISRSKTTARSRCLIAIRTSTPSRSKGLVEAVERVGENQTAAAVGARPSPTLSAMRRVAITGMGAICARARRSGDLGRDARRPFGDQADRKYPDRLAQYQDRGGGAQFRSARTFRFQTPGAAGSFRGCADRGARAVAQSGSTFAPARTANAPPASSAPESAARTHNEQADAFMREEPARASTDDRAPDGERAGLPDHDRLRLTGPSFAVVSACASANHAMAQAFLVVVERWILP
jgi:hypothetical protein